MQWLKEKWNKSNNDLSRKSKNTMTKGKVKQVKQRSTQKTKGWISQTRHKTDMRSDALEG